MFSDQRELCQMHQCENLPLRVLVSYRLGLVKDATVWNSSSSSSAQTALSHAEWPTRKTPAREGIILAINQLVSLARHIYAHVTWVYASKRSKRLLRHDQQQHKCAYNATPAESFDNKASNKDEETQSGVHYALGECVKVAGRCAKSDNVQIQTEYGSI